ncbi:unnamed protein product [Parnassius mnemosyne]|uniref:Reverse transcriptase domain-containing protein n=1 Tax=Parnassius mnemosyne TaxID=213953 RepID=A0AAV1LMH7_9NEOP
MEDYRTVIGLLTKGAFCATIDLKEAYLLVPIDNSQRQFLRFIYNNKYYEFNALPYGLCSAPCVFTKIMKVVVTHLRSRGLNSVIYLDDILCIGSNYISCLKNVQETTKLLECLGLIINKEKSALEPKQKFKYLGFQFNSTNMTISLPNDKRVIVSTLVSKFIKIKHCTIRELSKLIGTLTAVCPAIEYGWLYTKILERQKYLTLIQNNSNYDATITLPSIIKEDLSWWSLKISNTCKHIRKNQYTKEIYTDASRTGWGCVCGKEKVNGLWKISEQEYHINYLELKAVFLGLKLFAKYEKNCEILLRVDNTTAISYVNRMGGIQFPHLNQLARNIWQWCEERHIKLTASYISSKENTEADFESRKTNIDTEWELCEKAYNIITKELGMPEIDLFASRQNAKCSKYISWKQDPEALNIDAFTINWGNLYFYAFPPFSLILKCLQKIKNDKAIGIVVIPWWPSQPWFPLAQILLISDWIIFKPHKKLLLSPFRITHPLYQQLTLVAGKLSGKH